MARKTVVGAAMVYGAGVGCMYRGTRSYGVLSRPVCAFLAVGWPGIVAGVAIAYVIQKIGDR